MKKIIYNAKVKSVIANAFLALAVLFVFASCNEDLTPSLWEDKPKGDTPVISEVSPANTALAGVTIITIKGSNFLSDPSKNYVYFGGKQASIISASPTELVVKAPDITGNLKLKIGVFGAELFSNEISYTLEPAVENVYAFKEFELPYAVAIDASNNIFFSLVSDNIGKGIMKLTPDGTLTNFAPKGGETFYNSIKVGPGGKIYGVRNARAVFEISEGSAPVAWSATETSLKFVDLDFDAAKNIWTAGAGGKIYRFTSATDKKGFDFAKDITALRVFNDGGKEYLYVATTSATEKAVYRMEIVSKDELGTPELYFDFSSKFDILTKSITAITFAQDGDLFLGLNSSETIVVVHPDKSFSSWYPGLIKEPVINFTWDNGNNLYYSRGKITNVDGKITSQQFIIRVNMEKPGAPYYGRN
ncbi:MAG: hypothetical protein Fur0015_08610 [Ignavibacteriales bacterium]